MKVKLNDDEAFVKEIKSIIKKNNGHCCCAITFEPDNKCMCKAFREQISRGEPGYCGCGLYYAEEE